MATPTPEQAKIVEAFKTGDNLVIEAGAGTGKTTTLRLMAEATPDRKGIYVAYNRAIANDAKGSFPSNVHCATAHSLAFRAKGVQYKHRLNGPRITARDTASILGINHLSFNLSNEAGSLNPTQIARLAMQTVDRFCNSADDKPEARHVPQVPGTEDRRAALTEMIVPLARKAWADLEDRNGRLKFQHDHYLKMWAMTNPRLNCDFVLLDEAQDANPVIAQVVEAQVHAQQIMVGDRSQAIYGWRGAVDAMSNFNCDQRLVLSQSFRFGDAVAVEANKWLDLLDAPLRLTGFAGIVSTVEVLANPDAILCRTNSEVIVQALSAQEKGQSVAVVGGTTEIRMLAEGALDLQSGRSAYHPDLMAFKSWGEVQQYVQEEESVGTLKTFVKLIDDYGAEQVINIANKTVNEDRADVIVSTAHKAKGREWDTVRIAGDFQAPVEGEEASKPEMMLAYVAVTRAKTKLDNEGLSWVNNLV